MFRSILAGNKIYSLLSGVFLLLSLFGSVALVRQNQDLRNRAATGSCGAKPADQCPYPNNKKMLGVNPVCDTQTQKWDYDDQLCDQSGRTETCNGQQWCCPMAGTKWQLGPCGEDDSRENFTLTLEKGRKLKLYLVNLITDNTYQITLANKADPNKKVTLTTPQLSNNQDHFFDDVLTVDSVNNQYDITVQLIGEPGPAYGWRPLNSGTQTCGLAGNGNEVIDVSSYIDTAKQQSHDPHHVQCWADYELGDTTQDYDFNDFLIVLGYDQPVEPTPTDLPQPTSTPAPTATGTLKPTNTPVPTSTPKPTSTPLPTNTPKPTATGTLKPTNTPLPTSTPKPTSTPLPTNTPKPTSTPVPTNTPKPTSTPVLVCGSTCADGLAGQCPSDHTCYSGKCVLSACISGEDVICTADSCHILTPTATRAPIAQEPSPTRIILPQAGVDFPVKGLVIFGTIISLLGFLVLL